MKKFFFLLLLAMATTRLAAQEFDFNEVTSTPQATTFRLFAPRKAKVSVEIGPEFSSKEVGQTQKYKMRLGKDGIWTVTVNQNLKNRMYWFNVDGKRSVGVFAKAVGVNSSYGMVADLSETNPEGWERDKRPVVKSPADLVVYEMHHRDFSIDASSGLKHKGKFLALTEPKAIRHLKDLGVNAVHILPSYDFGSVNETRLQENRYNWGYDPVNYNVPEGSYSTNPYDPTCRIREFKQMVQALHKAGIRVILDVVYNHTYDIENSNFQKTYPDYYYRKTPKKGNNSSPIGEAGEGSAYSNGSGCGNETASEQPMMRRFMIESVKYWINEYHIDGFRFDLMGCHDIETMNAIRKAVDEIDPTIFIYGEGWSAGQCALPAEQLASKANIPMLPRIAAFSDELRDGLRGPFSDDTKGAFLAGLQGEEESIKFGIAGCISHPQVDMQKVNYSKKAWATEPTQMISYVSCHDDMCLVDRLKASIPGIKMDELIRLDLLAQTAVFTSQGVPFMLSGEEMLRDKKGVHNSFESPDSINHLDWDNLKKYPQVFKYYKDLIQLRKDHPAFRLGSADLVRKHLEFLAPLSSPLGGKSGEVENLPQGGGLEGAFIAFRLKDHAGGDSWKDIYVVLNASRKQQTVALPMDSYETVCDDGRISETGIRHFMGDKVTVAPQSALILHN
ncbi:MAG: type I pullulanase [Prevotella sp.]|nr:type I pullulanase [Prevotella sp.]